VTGPEDELERRLRAEADLPREPLTEALDAYRVRFGELPPVTLMGVPSARFPALIAELHAAVADGVPRSNGDLLRTMNMTPPPEDATI